MSVIALTFRLMAATSLLAIGAASAGTTLQQLPKGAHAGECFSHVTTPSTWRTDRVPVPQPPLVSWRDIPAVYNTVSKQVLVTPGRVDRESIPAVMGTRRHWVEHPGADRVVEAPAVYRWEVKRILISPARLIWKPGHAAQGYGGGGYGQSMSVSPTGEVMCRVLIPARYEVRRVRVLVTPGRTCIVKGPSTRESVVEHFVITPAHVVEHPVAPVYRTVSERVLVTPGRRERVVTPQPPRFAEKRVQVGAAHAGWTRIDCAPPAVRSVRVVRPTSGVQPRRPNYPERPAYVVHPQHSAYGVHLQPGDAGYGQAPIYSHTPASGQYIPDYARPRPGQLEGAPTQPSYHAPQTGEGYGGSSSY